MIFLLMDVLPGPLPIVYFTVKVNCQAKTTTVLVLDYSVPDGTFFKPCRDYLTIIPRVQMGY